MELRIAVRISPNRNPHFPESYAHFSKSYSYFSESYYAFIRITWRGNELQNAYSTAVERLSVARLGTLSNPLVQRTISIFIFSLYCSVCIFIGACKPVFCTQYDVESCPGFHGFVIRALRKNTKYGVNWCMKPCRLDLRFSSKIALPHTSVIASVEARSAYGEHDLCCQKDKYLEAGFCDHRKGVNV